MERETWRAFHDFEAELCPGCGQPLSESLHDPKIPEAEAARYAAKTRRCNGCKAIDDKQSALRQRDEQRSKQLGRTYTAAGRQVYIERVDCEHEEVTDG